MTSFMVVEIVNCKVANNRLHLDESPNHGPVNSPSPGVFLVNITSRVTIRGCDFINNTAGNSNGGAVGLWNVCDLRISHSRFLDNAATHRGGAVSIVTPLWFSYSLESFSCTTLSWDLLQHSQENNSSVWSTEEIRT